MPQRERFTLSISVFAYIESAHTILMLRRANTGWHDGDFSLPAGALDGEETLAQAAARELREETGLQVAPEAFRLAHTLHARNPDGVEWLGVFFAASAPQEAPTLMETDKHDLLAWHDGAALPPNTIPYVRQAIACIRDGIPYSSHGWPAAL
jgi:8-oxo-dGTP pyrophosphatase MutT (NUDIX family)